MPITFVKPEQKAAILQQVEQWKTSSKTNNQAVKKEDVEKFQQDLKRAGIDIMTEAQDSGADLKSVYQNLMVIGGNSADNLNPQINGGAPTTGINNQWTDSLNKLLAGLQAAPILVTKADITVAAGNGSNDAVDVATIAKTNEMNPGTVVSDATKAYQAKLLDPSATSEDIGKAQRQVMLAYQTETPRNSIDQFHDYMRQVVGYAGDGQGGVIEPARKQEITDSLGSMSFSDIAKNANKYREYEKLDQYNPMQDRTPM